MVKPFALFLTWTCYGNWLPGDKRGYVSNTLRPDGSFEHKRNVPGTEYATDDLYTRNNAKRLMHYSKARLTLDLSIVAAEAFIDTAQSQHWTITRGAVMSNHIHLLVHDCPDDGPAVRRIFKGRSQARLSDAFGSNRRWWTAGGFDSYLHSEEAIEEKSDYIHRQPFIIVEIDDMKVVARVNIDNQPKRES
jgi:REP element-mobilizing transposase RayT